MLKTLSTRNTFLLLLAVACLTIIPFLGLTDFHTKGEPREAVVALSILDSGDWVLPRNNGGEIPYKPPFFHWGIAVASAVGGGTVNEFTSRLPSAIALITMTMAVFLFYARRKGTLTGLVTALICLTTFELHRAGANCRVDMMLTALSVVALLLFYRYWERDLRGVPIGAILLMSCATLTKGPVGTLIPCLAFGVFLLLRGVDFFKAAGLLILWGVCSLILPLCWYWAAYGRGGQEFLDLVLEENFGRMTGTMSYDACVNPWYYNVQTVLAGFAPWVLLLLFSLFSLKKIRRGRSDASSDADSSRASSDAVSSDASYAEGRARASSPKGSLWQRILAADPVDLFSLTCVAVIFIFFCIPSSKRSVYLMPLYPFLAYFIAQYAVYLTRIGSRAVKVYGSLLAGVALLLTAAFFAIKAGMVPEGIFSGRHAADNVAILRALQGISGWAVVAAMVPTLLSLWWIVGPLRRPTTPATLLWVAVLTLGLYFSLDAAYQSAALSPKSKRILAQDIDRIAPASSGTLYEYIHVAENTVGDPIHFFEINFYLGDRMENFLRNKPDEGYLLIPTDDAELMIPEFTAMGYSFTPLYNTPRKALHSQYARLYHFRRDGRNNF